MPVLLKVKVTREVLSKTTFGVASNVWFDFPLRIGAYHLKFIELDEDMEILDCDLEKKTALVRLHNEEISLGEGKLNYTSFKLKDRFFFQFHFYFEEEDYGDDVWSEYVLDVHEVYYHRDNYNEFEDEMDYTMDVRLKNRITLELINQYLDITAIDKKNGRVKVEVGMEEVVVSLDKPGEYSNGYQAGYNDSFEIVGRNVEIRLRKK